jgi:glycosyltransferase involved in cell wall biosynthesis
MVAVRLAAEELDREQQGSAVRPPRLLYIGEFPPSNHHGGAILVKRLLEKHPADCLTVITSTGGIRASRASGLVECHHIALPVFARPEPVGIRPLVRAANALCLGLVALKAVLEVRRRRIEALITIVQGRYYLAAALAAWATATPHITIVHDNFVSANSSPSNLSRKVLRHLTGKTLRSAAHIYAVSPEMQGLVFRECGVGSEIQLPSSALSTRHAGEKSQLSPEGAPVILFAGTMGFTVRDCLDLLADLIATGQLKAKLRLHTAMTESQMRTFGRNCPDIICKSWVAQPDLQEALSGADILFLPYSFLESSRAAVETAFPSKIADYLAAAKPILVFGPRYSSLVRYASDQGFAEVVDKFSAAALKRGIQTIVSLPRYKEKLAARALEVFSANHDIRCQQQKFYLTLERIVRRAHRCPGG